jgi:hypothetical protein
MIPVQVVGWLVLIHTPVNITSPALLDTRTLETRDLLSTHSSVSTDILVASIVAHSTQRTHESVRKEIADLSHPIHLGRLRCNWTEHYTLDQVRHTILSCLSLCDSCGPHTYSEEIK